LRDKLEKPERKKRKKKFNPERKGLNGGSEETRCGGGGVESQIHISCGPNQT